MQLTVRQPSAALDAKHYTTERLRSEYVIESIFVADDAVFMYINDITDRNEAERLRGEFLYIDRAHAVELDEDSTFLCDLYGLRGIDDSGRDFGTLKDVMQPGGNDVYIFNGPMGEVLVPALKSVVIKVDLEKGEMLMNAERLNEVAVFDED